MNDRLTPLRCTECGAVYDDRWRCRCGGVLEYAEPLFAAMNDGSVRSGDPPASSTFDSRDGLWSFRRFLPEEPHVTLGEGLTPLVSAPAWDASFKLEYVFPTGSFKDRGATTTISRAIAADAKTVLEDSSGNAGAAIATYAARAELDARIYVPAAAKRSKLRAIERAGATPVPIEGPRSAATDACIEAVDSGEGWYASHAWNPAFLAGTATIAYEIALQRDWEVPDALVTPLGHGTLFLGAYWGFRALREIGWTDSMPRLLGAQAAGYAPIADRFEGRADERSDADGRNDVADGIQITEPVREREIHEAIEATEGDAIAIGTAAVERHLDRLHRSGFYVEPTCAIAPAALERYRDRGTIASGDDVVVPLTGSGLKQ